MPKFVQYRDGYTNRCKTGQGSKRQIGVCERNVKNADVLVVGCKDARRMWQTVWKKNFCRQFSEIADTLTNTLLCVIL